MQRSAAARRVVSFESGAWVVTTPYAVRASYRSLDRADAVARAQRIVRNAGGGEVEVRTAEGGVERVMCVHTRRGAGSPSDLRVR